MQCSACILRFIYRPKPCEYNKDISLKTLNDKNHLASSQKFRQLFIFGFVAYQLLKLFNAKSVFIQKKSAISNNAVSISAQFN